jgi:hypothetical protein
MPGIAIRASELPEFLVQEDHLAMSWDRIKAAQLAGFGVVVNTFVDLERPYCEEFSRVVGEPSRSAVHRGGDGEMDCVRWLSTKPGRSVVFVCFGTWAHFSARQVRELALGLEASNQTFLWMNSAGDSDALEGWE